MLAILAASTVRTAPTSLWTQTFIDAYNASPADVHLVLTITGPFGTLRISSAGVTQVSPDGLSSAYFEAKVESWPEFFSGLSSVTATALELREVEVQVDDSDGYFASLKYGAAAATYQGATAVVQLAALNCDPSQWPYVFVGELDRIGYGIPLHASLFLKPGNPAWESTTPIAKVGPDDYTNAYPDAVNKPLPVAVGIMRTTGLNIRGGACPALYVDTAAFNYILTRGVEISDAAGFEIYKDNAKQTTGFTVSKVKIGGRTMYQCDFNSDVSGSKITFNTVGIVLTTNQDPNDDYIDDPLGTFLFLVANYVLGDYADGPATDPYSLPDFDVENMADLRAWLVKNCRGSPGAQHAYEVSTNGFACGRYYGREQESFLHLLQTFCEGYALRPFLQGNGRIAAGSLVSPQNNLYDAPWIDLGAMEHDGSLQVEPAQDSPVTRISVEHTRIEVDSKGYYTTEVADVDNPRGDISTDRTHEWAMASADEFRYLRPTAFDSASACWSGGRNGTAGLALTDVTLVSDDYMIEDDDGGYAECNTTQTGVVRWAVEAPPALAKIISVKVQAWAKYFNSGVGGNHQITLFTRIGGTQYQSGLFTLTQSYQMFEFTWLTNPNTLAAWTADDLAALIIGVNVQTVGDLRRVSRIGVWVEYAATGQSAAAIRDATSRELLVLRSPPDTIKFRGPLSLASYPNFTPLALTHPYAPSATGLGWFAPKWKRKYILKTAHVIKGNDHEVEVQGVDLAGLNVPLWETAKLIDGASQGITRPGPAEWCVSWLGRRFVRQTGGQLGQGATLQGYAWSSLPTDRSIVRMSANVGARERRGILLENFARNAMINPQFYNFAAAQWTTFGVGGTITVGLDASTPTPYSPPRTAQVVRLRSGASTPAVDYGFGTTAAIAGLDNGRVLLVYKNTTRNGTIAFAAQRSSDSKWWNNTTRTWVTSASKVWNAVPQSSSSVLFDKWWSEPLSGSGATHGNILFYVGVPNGTGVASQDDHIADFSYISEDTQETGVTSLGAAHSPIFQGAITAIVATCGNMLGYYSRLGQRLWKNDGGALVFDYEPTWDSDRITYVVSRYVGIFMRYRDASNFDLLFFNPATLSIDYRRYIGGVRYALTTPYTINRGAPIHFALRWGSDLGEHDEAPWHVSLWINGVKKFTGGTARPLLMGATETLLFGPACGDPGLTGIGFGSAGVTMPDEPVTMYRGAPGYYANILSTLNVPSDNEMLGLR